MEHLGLEKMIKNASWIWKITRLHPHVRKCLFVDFAELFTVHRSETANPSFGHSSSLLVQFISEWIMIMHQHGNLDLFEIARESSVFPCNSLVKLRVPYLVVGFPSTSPTNLPRLTTAGATILGKVYPALDHRMSHELLQGIVPWIQPRWDPRLQWQIDI